MTFQSLITEDRTPDSPKAEKRWIKPLLAEAAAFKVRMPWERGLRRQAFINRCIAAETARLPLAARIELQRATA